MTRPGNRAVSDRVVVAVFAIVLLAPWVDMALGLDPTPALSENRRLREWPSRGQTRRVIEYLVGARDWFQDHFGFRRLLLATNTGLRLSLGESPSPKVILGRDGWLFYAGNRVVEDYLGQRPLAPAELARWVEALTIRSGMVAHRGGRYRFIVAPDKVTLYPEYLPPAMPPRAPGSTLQQVGGAMAAHGSEVFFTLVRELEQAKRGGQVYYRTDTHWTPRGIRAAEAAIAEVAGLAGVPWDEPLAEEVAFREGGDLTQMMNAGGQYRETIFRSAPASVVAAGTESEVVRWTDPVAGDVSVSVSHYRGGAGGQGLLFGDSFGGKVAPYLARRFSHLVLVPMHPDDATFARFVERFRADVVLEERTERYLKYPPLLLPSRDRATGFMAAE